MPRTRHACLLFELDTCIQARGSRVQLPAVPYGRQGPWAINLWFKPSNESGNQFQYLFSHNSTEFSNYSANPYSPNQVGNTCQFSFHCCAPRDYMVAQRLIIAFFPVAGRIHCVC